MHMLKRNFTSLPVLLKYSSFKGFVPFIVFLISNTRLTGCPRLCVAIQCQHCTNNDVGVRNGTLVRIYVRLRPGRGAHTLSNLNFWHWPAGRGHWYSNGAATSACAYTYMVYIRIRTCKISHIYRYLVVLLTCSFHKHFDVIALTRLQSNVVDLIKGIRR